MRAHTGSQEFRNGKNADGGQMTDKRTIDLGGSYRLVVMDERNWKLQHLHVPASNNGRGGTEVKWNDTGNYFQRLAPALAHVFERRMREEGEPDEALADAMERAERIRDELMGVTK